ncbi:helix-turn-helix domain containing protein [Actinoplanes sp. KI2]|uniref:helix-turn-helix domain-containing protein n=1 Tax=Actinoplanes sp. KI2 TaxID=2983315 RepID=UPI0021D5D9FE|nr:helix-turn-helix domain containing protein [Actinoplanes sp. KI2]MCU7729411.1 helix-turn-helix domain containing protein [Actinoplanes sp. KI2]
MEAGELNMIDSRPSEGVARQHSVEARAALDELMQALDHCLDQLRDARHRAAELAEQHDSGQSWTAIVSAETPPLIVERISVAMSALSVSGSRWRRAQALVLHAEGVSINRIAALFRVTRQRISALINGHAQ